MVDAVVCRALRVVRGGNEVLRGIDLSVRAGEVTGLLGPSGSGKTTAMRSLVGTQIVTSGTVTVLGLPAGDPSLRTHVGYSTQAASIYPDLTVHENLRYFAAAMRAPKADIDRVIGQVGLDDYVDRIAGRLSGGQRSRVSLAVALLGEPRLLVLDEPTTGLDPLLREEIWSVFAALAADGVAVLVSSHVMEEAQRCARIVLLREGETIAYDTPAALQQRTGTSDMDAAFLALVSATGTA